MRSWQLASIPVPLSPAPADRDGPTAGDADLVGFHGLTAGVWEMSEGVAVDVEADELSVVLSGRGMLEIEGAETIELEPGVLFRLHEGDRTRWTVHERLRKLYLVAGDEPGAR